VVTGLGVVTSIGHNVDAFWSSLVAGRGGIQRVAHFDPSEFASQIGAEVRDWDVTQHMDPKEARRNDRYTHFGFVAAKQAVADSRLDMTREDSDRVGVMIGSGIGGIFTFETQLAVMALVWSPSSMGRGGRISGWCPPVRRARTPWARRRTRSDAEMPT
jgi:3-oxoacyl-[acyl-carrier-protein] synthase II